MQADWNWILAQAWLFFAAFFGGAVAGALYRIYQQMLSRKARLRRAYWKGDLLFGAVLILLLLLFWFSATDGSLRLVDCIGFCLGFFPGRRLVEAVLFRLPMRRFSSFGGKRKKSSAKTRKQWYTPVDKMALGAAAFCLQKVEAVREKRLRAAAEKEQVDDGM